MSQDLPTAGGPEAAKALSRTAAEVKVHGDEIGTAAVGEHAAEAVEQGAEAAGNAALAGAALGDDAQTGAVAAGRVAPPAAPAPAAAPHRTLQPGPPSTVAPPPTTALPESASAAEMFNAMRRPGVGSIGLPNTPPGYPPGPRADRRK